MRRISMPALVAGFLLAGQALSPALADGGSATPPPPSLPQESPQALAADLYNKGLGLRDRGWKYEEDALEVTDPAQRQKLQAKAQKQYVKSISYFKAAVDKDPGMHQAHGSLGYALRKTGDLENALLAYDQSLSLKPDYAEAIEYRGEAYLKLGRIDDAKQAYLTLFASDRERAAQLLDAMKHWMGEQEARAGSPGSGAAESLAGWVETRDELAGHAQPVSRNRKW